MKDWKAEINSARKNCQRDPDLVFFIVRDWEITNKAGLADYAWTASKQCNMTPGEAEDILNKLEEFILEAPHV